MLIAYIVSFSSIYILFKWGWNRSVQKKIDTSKYQAENISVIIPFRNEIKNLNSLKESILQLYSLPLEFIWINDHSEDNSLSVLTNLPSNHTVISLNRNEKGKKTAIRKGIEISSGTFILTWDADISVPLNYFSTLTNQSIADLAILPVRMIGSTFIEILYELDYYFLNSINMSVSGFYDPIVASGANLLFNKSTFLEIDSFDTHKYIASGDDQFLLADFKKHNKEIQIITDLNLVVETHTPQSLQSFFQQRLRWITKSTHIKDTLANLTNTIGIFYVLGFVCLLMYYDWRIIVGFKIILDMLIFKPYLKCIDRKPIIWFTPCFSLLYPLYFFAISLGMLFYRNQKWKGRK
ncbi:MAG: glycosyltransferase [Crocinitomicaceae bacterium]|nr:glycosyltransferase [Crocinitomicaceae bacterium]